MKQDPALQVQRIDELMESRGWKPGELAERSGVAYDTIYKIRASRGPRTSAEIVAKLAIALGCSVDYLLGLADEPLPSGEKVMSALLIDLCNIANALSEPRQRDLLRIAEALQVAGQDETQDDLHAEMMQIVLAEIQRISGDDALSEVLDRLESKFPDQGAAWSKRARAGR